MPRLSFTDVTTALCHAGMPTRELHGSGHVVVSLAAGRVMAMAFAKEGPNLLWSNPQLSDAELVRHQPEKLVGGLGGDRVWFAPELDYHWKGAPDWKGLTNNRVPAASDPGAYEFIDKAPHEIALQASGGLRHRMTRQRVGFEVVRTLRMVPSPLAEDDPLRIVTDYVGIETSYVLRFDADTRAGQLDLWHLLQIPAGSILIVPLRTGCSSTETMPLSYTGSRGWIRKPDQVLWRYSGAAHAKFGLSAGALTGRTAVLQKLESQYCLIVRQFHVDPSARYADHPYGVPRSDQAFQAWDGLGFGEMEYHSPLIDAQSGPREIGESDQLWAFGGSQAAIRAIGERLLQCDLTDALLLVDSDSK